MVLINLKIIMRSRWVTVTYNCYSYLSWWDGMFVTFPVRTDKPVCDIWFKMGGRHTSWIVTFLLRTNEQTKQHIEVGGPHKKEELPENPKKHQTRIYHLKHAGKSSKNTDNNWFLWLLVSMSYFWVTYCAFMHNLHLLQKSQQIFPNRIIKCIFNYTAFTVFVTVNFSFLSHHLS